MWEGKGNNLRNRCEWKQQWEKQLRIPVVTQFNLTAEARGKGEQTKQPLLQI